MAFSLSDAVKERGTPEGRLKVALEEAAGDIARMNKDELAKLSSTYVEALELLLQHGILPSEKKTDLVDMIRFRNRAVHLYDEILPADIWTILETRLGDFDVVVEALAARYF